MPNFANWIGSEGDPVIIAEIIGYKSVSTGTITRGSGTVAAQTIRLETLSGSRQVQGQGGITYMIDAMALGYKGHATIADTDLKVGDRFTVALQTFEVIAIAPGMTDNMHAYLKLRS